MKHYLLPILLLLSVGVYAQGNRELSIDFNYLFSGSTSVELGTSAHTHTDGAQITFDAANYYVSNIRLVPISGADVVYDTVLIINATNAGLPYQLGQLPVGAYQSIKFDIGLDYDRNHSDPSTYNAVHPMSFQSPSMHWSWSSGYIFVRIEGMIDTSATLTGATVPYEYHIGTDNLLKEVSVPIALEVDANTQSISANIDLLLGTVIGGLSLKDAADVSTHTMDNMPLANTLMTNMQSAFVGEVNKVQLTGISDITASQKMSIYPNPLVSSATLEVNNSGYFNTIEVVDVTGKTIFKQALNGNSVKLFRSQFPAAGVYMVKVSGEGSIVRKLVVY